MIKVYNEWGDEITLPTRKVVCPRCHGTGSHVNPAIDGNGITQSDREDWADDDFMEDYFSGVYNVTCEECNGKNVIDEVDEDRCDHVLLKLYYQKLWEEHEYRRMQYMESGGWEY